MRCRAVWQYDCLLWLAIQNRHFRGSIDALEKNDPRLHLDFAALQSVSSASGTTHYNGKFAPYEGGRVVHACLLYLRELVGVGKTVGSSFVYTDVFTFVS